MSLELYRGVIDRWCAATGMQAWDPQDVAHVEVGATPVTLHYDAARGLGFLDVYCDLGTVHVSGLHRQLLATNLEFDLAESGNFAIHPESDAVYYRARIPMNESLDGALLPERIEAIVEAATRHLHS